MNKILLKRLLYELLEEIGRLELQLNELENQAEANILPYVTQLVRHMEGVKERVFAQREQFLLAFQEATLDEAFIHDCINSIFPEIRSSLAPVRKALYQLKKREVLPETELYLNSLGLTKLVPDAPGVVVIPVESQAQQADLPTFESLIVSSLPILDAQSPLPWFGLADRFTEYFSVQSIQMASLFEEIGVPQSEAKYITPVLNLRLLGPGYYAYFVLKSLELKQFSVLQAVEPVLFQALNRFGLVNKDLVILHQSLERLRQSLPVSEEAHSVVQLFGKEDVADRILKAIEKVIPERLAYTEKALLKSQLLEERLERGMLISAVPMLGSPAQLREDLQKLEQEGIDVYGILHQIQETPASPREIINAGWLHKLDQSPAWLQAVLMAPQDEWSVFRTRIAELDNILLKSIEIAEVHRVLSFEESDALMPV